MSKNRITDFATMILIVGVACTRLLPHWPNFTPVLAIALCGGLLYGDRRAYLVPLVAMIISDLAMGIAFGAEYALHTTQLYVYGSVLATTVLGRALSTRSTTSAVLLGGTLSGIGFFVVTNGAVWLHGTMYPHTFEGLMACYGAGLAFYRDGGNFLLNGIVSTWVFSGAILLARSAMTRPAISMR